MGAGKGKKRVKLTDEVREFARKAKAAGMTSKEVLAEIERKYELHPSIAAVNAICKGIGKRARVAPPEAAEKAGKSSRKLKGDRWKVVVAKSDESIDAIAHDTIAKIDQLCNCCREKILSIRLHLVKKIGELQIMKEGADDPDDGDTEKAASDE